MMQSCTKKKMLFNMKHLTFCNAKEKVLFEVIINVTQQVNKKFI